MEHKIEFKPKSLVEILVSVTGTDFNNYMNITLKNLKDNLKVPGFRNGCIPDSIIKTKYHDLMAKEFMLVLVDKTVENIVKEANLKRVSEFKITNYNFEEGKADIKVEVSVLPEIKLENYKNFDIKAAEQLITDKEVELGINELVHERSKATNLPAEALSELGNIITIDFDGTLDGERLPGLKGTNVSLELGKGEFLEGFESNLLGRQVGDKFVIELKFPADYFKKDFAEKVAVFDVAVKGLAGLEKPIVDDNFAKTLGIDNLAELKLQIKNRMQAAINERTENRIISDVFEKILKNTVFEVPEILLENEAESRLEALKEKLKNDGLTLKKYLENVNKTEEQLMADYKKEADIGIKEILIMEKVAELEGITATEEDAINRIIDMFYKPYGINKSVEEMRQMPQIQNMLPRAISEARLDKTRKFLLDNNRK